MKRTLCLILAAVVTLTLLPAVVFAKEAVTRIEVEAACPVAGEKPGAPEVKILAQGEGEARPLTEMEDDYAMSFQWREKDASDAMTGEFVKGRAYDLVITLKGLLKNYAVSDETVIALNGDAVNTKPAPKGEEDAVVTLTMTATANDVTPAVLVAPEEGNTEKEYDGKNVVLHASVQNKIKNAAYTYQWYRDGEAVKGGTADNLVLRDVAQSGGYTCRVKAVLGQESGESESVAIPVKITPHAIAILLENAEKNDGDPDPVLSYTVVGTLYDDLQGAPAREEGEAEGEYEIGLGTLAFSEEAQGNYVITVQTGKFTIVGTGVATFAPLTDVADLSYLTGRGGAKTRVSATKSALPKGGILTLSTVPAEDLAKLTEAAGDKGLMKSLTLSLSQEDGASAKLRKNAVLRIYLPLTEEEERYDPETLTALFRTADGKIRPVTLGREAAGASGVVYVSVELTEMGELALVKGTLIPEETEPAPTVVAKPEPPKKGAP
ncbi:MAG: immunoglobulin domain-containing protein, partial [Clostridia bacterium]|nr:immunoglobulin domain-containing protein [Clostridia bacterium]